MTTNTVVDAGPARPSTRTAAGRRTARPCRRQLTAGRDARPASLSLVGALLGWPIVWTFLLSLTNETADRAHGPPSPVHRPGQLHRAAARLRLPQLAVAQPRLPGRARPTIGQVVLGFALAFLLRRCSRRVQALSARRHHELDRP